MNDKEAIRACYEAMYDGMIRKDTEYLKTCLDESYVLVHMTGVKMDWDEFFEALHDGTLNYYRCRHEHMNIQVHGDTGRIIGDTRVEAAVYGGSMHVWPLRLDCTLIRKEGKWKMTGSKASTYQV